MAPLIIDRITVHAGRMPVKLRFSYGAPADFPFILVRVAAGGLEGVGESLMEGPEGLEPTLRALLGRDANGLDGLLGEGGHGYGGEAFIDTVVQEMLSMALHDLVGKARGVPLHELLGGAARTMIPMMPCIFPESPVDAAEKAQRFCEQGFGALKVKIFGEEAGDLEIVRAVREVMPQGHLQADANAGYTTDIGASRLLEQFAAAGLTVIEDPFAATLDEYALLCRENESPRIMLDAPTRGWAGLREICEKRAAHQINLHPCNQGRFAEILQRAAMAKAAGIPVAIGGTGFTGIGAYGFAHIAAVAGTDMPYGECGGAFDHGMPVWSTTEPLPVVRGELQLPSAAGHGGVLDFAAVEGFVEGSMEVY